MDLEQTLCQIGIVNSLLLQPSMRHIIPISFTTPFFSCLLYLIWHRSLWISLSLGVLAKKHALHGTARRIMFTFLAKARYTTIFNPNLPFFLISCISERASESANTCSFRHIGPSAYWETGHYVWENAFNEQRVFSGLSFFECAGCVYAHV